MIAAFSLLGLAVVLGVIVALAGLVLRLVPKQPQAAPLPAVEAAPVVPMPAAEAANALAVALVSVHALPCGPTEHTGAGQRVRRRQRLPFLPPRSKNLPPIAPPRDDEAVHLEPAADADEVMPDLPWAPKLKIYEWQPRGDTERHVVSAPSTDHEGGL